MLWSDLYQLLSQKLPEVAAKNGQRPLLWVDASRQQMQHIHVDALADKTYPVSTAANGLGNLEGSNKTPTGIHRIKQKIGAGEPPGMVFKAREASGRVSHRFDNRDEDEITTRILWLDGLEPGFNKDGDQDSYSRYIYIHGSSDEKRIGQAVSLGCIRMRNLDVIALFDRVEVDDIVIIQ